MPGYCKDSISVGYQYHVYSKFIAPPPRPWSSEALRESTFQFLLELELFWYVVNYVITLVGQGQQAIIKYASISVAGWMNIQRSRLNHMY